MTLHAGAQMRFAIVVATLALVAWTPILASGAGRPPPIPEPKPLKCVQCEGNQCHAVYGPGSQYCIVTEGGCFEDGGCE